METTLSFAPLAGRLAASAAELRPAERSRNNLAKFMALVVCALLDMLVYICEALDAGAIADMRAVAGQPVNRMSLDVSRKSPSCAGSASLSTTAPARVRKVVDNRAKFGLDGVKTVVPFVSYPTTLGGPTRPWLFPGRSRSFSRAPLRKAAFPTGFMHVYFVAIS